MEEKILNRVKQAAHGHWQEIHRRLGIPETYLNPHKHCPCPSCGGRDRYRYTNHKGEGCYICNQCGAGSGFDLLMLIYGYDFTQALKDVAGALGISKETITPPKPFLALPTIPQGQDQLPRLEALWQASTPMGNDVICPIHNYLTGRGLSAMGAIASLRYAPELPYWYEGRVLHHYPAMLARIDDSKGQIQGLHLTYLQSHYPRPYGENGLHCPQFSKLKLTHKGEDLPVKKMRVRLTGAIKGAGVYLHPYQDCLGVAEGIESALAAHELFAIPMCATLSAYGMRSFIIPEGVSSLVIVGDNDSSGTGQKALQALKIKALKQGLDVKTWQAPSTDTDALDYLNQIKGQKND